MTTVRGLRRHRARASERKSVGATPMALGASTVAIVGLAVTMEVATYDIWGAFWVGPLLLLLCVPLANKIARVDDDVRAGHLVMIAAIVKILGGSVARYATDFGIYGGSDATRYHDAGVQLAPLFRSGIYDDLGKISGTRFTEILTGHVYAVIGPTRLGGFMVFSFMGFVGLVLFWRAFRLAIPDGDHRRYALLLFFFPTLLMWTSGTGKDAWMMLCLGVAGWGLAALYTGRLRGFPVTLLGLWGSAVVRPHLALIFVIAAAASVPIVLLRRQAGSIPRGVGPRLVLVALLAIVALPVIDRAEEVFRLDELNVESAQAVTDRVQDLTGRSGSTYQPPDPTSPIGYAQSLATVLFRPFPFEVDNAQGLATAAEGFLLLIVVYTSLRRSGRLPIVLLRVPYLMFALTFVATFVYAFAAISNFGILARQRAQLLPALLILLCGAVRTRDAATSDHEDSTEHHVVTSAR